jgi:hypothetical protein
VRIDRRRLLVQFNQAKTWANDPRLPDDLRVQAKKAADHAEVALGLQDALARKRGLPRAGLRAWDDPLNQPLDPSNPLKTSPND